MKIIELIKEKLGLDEKDLDKEIDLNSVKRIQMHLDDVADELIKQTTQDELDAKRTVELEARERMRNARQKQLNIKKVRDALKHQAGINPVRLAKLKKEGKL